MEKFVDRIIETDRKAREIIEQAQQEKQAIWTPSMRWTTPLRTGMTHGWPRSHKIRWPRCDARYA